MPIERTGLKCQCSSCTPGSTTKLNSPLIALILLSMVSNLLMLTGPLFMLQVYDRVLASRSVPTLLALTGLIIVLYAFSALLDALRTRIAVRVGNAIDANWSPRVFAAVLKARLVNSTKGPDPVRDLDTARQFVSSGGPLALLDLPWLCHSACKFGSDSVLMKLGS